MDRDDGAADALTHSAVANTENSAHDVDPTRVTPARDAIATVRNHLSKVVGQVRDGITRTLSGDERDADTDDAEGEGEAP